MTRIVLLAIGLLVAGQTDMTPQSSAKSPVRYTYFVRRVNYINSNLPIHFSTIDVKDVCDQCSKEREKKKGVYKIL